MELETPPPFPPPLPAGTRTLGYVALLLGAQRLAGWLLVPGTSGPTPSASGFDDTDIVHVLSEGFTVLIPQAPPATLPLGTAVPVSHLVPFLDFTSCLQNPGRSARAFKVLGARVQASTRTVSGLAVSMKPQSIIAVLISL